MDFRALPGICWWNVDNGDWILLDSSRWKLVLVCYDFRSLLVRNSFVVLYICGSSLRRSVYCLNWFQLSGFGITMLYHSQWLQFSVLWGYNALLFVMASTLRSFWLQCTSILTIKENTGIQCIKDFAVYLNWQIFFIKERL